MEKLVSCAVPVENIAGKVVPEVEVPKAEAPNLLPASDRLAGTVAGLAAASNRAGRGAGVCWLG